MRPVKRSPQRVLLAESVCGLRKLYASAAQPSSGFVIPIGMIAVPVFPSLQAFLPVALRVLTRWGICGKLNLHTAWF